MHIDPDMPVYYDNFSIFNLDLKIYMDGREGSHPKLKLEDEPRLLGKAMSI